MASLTQLKQEMQFNTQLHGLLEALKSIAAQQFQSLERTTRSHEGFFEAIQTIGGTFDVEHLTHPFTRRDGPIGVILITSDTGLLGGLNQQVVLTAIKEYRRQPGELMVIGERGVGYVREAGLPCRVFPSAPESGRRALANQVRDYALDQVLGGRLGGLSIVYPRALSFTLQRVELVRALPCTEWFQPGSARGVRSGNPVLLESSLTGLLEYLVWFWLGQRLYEVLGLSRLAELAARSVHLEGSCQELQRRGQRLRLRYFRQRHEIIDRSMRELFAAKSLYGN
jgi:F0F1-type ATP synthase gamma subunit